MSIPEMAGDYAADLQRIPSRAEYIAARKELPAADRAEFTRAVMYGELTASAVEVEMGLGSLDDYFDPKVRAFLSTIGLAATDDFINHRVGTDQVYAHSIVTHERLQLEALSLMDAGEVQVLDTPGYNSEKGEI